MLNHEFKLFPSKSYIAFICIIFILSIAIVLCLPINYIVKLGGMLLLIVYGMYLLINNGWLKGKHSIISLKYGEKKRWFIVTNDKMVEGDLLGDSTATSLLSVLRFRIEDQLLPLSCVIFKDSMQKDKYRQLLVLIRNSN